MRLWRAYHTCQLRLHVPRPGVGEDEVLDTLIRRIENVVGEFARDDTPCASCARGTGARLETRRTIESILPRTHDILPSSWRRGVRRSATPRHVRIVLYAFELPLQPLEDLILDVDRCLGCEGVDESEEDEGRFIVHLSPLCGRHGTKTRPLLLEVAHLAKEDGVLRRKLTRRRPFDQGIDAVFDAELERLHGSFRLELFAQNSRCCLC